MGMYDTFRDESTGLDAQLKCFECCLYGYTVGDEVPVEKFDFPKTATFCEWGGTSTKFSGVDIMGETRPMGTFVIIKDGKLLCITEDESQVVYPVYDKYGSLHKENNNG